MRRGFPSPDTVYISGSVNGVKVNFVVNTGAERTVVSKKIFDRINKKEQPSLVKRGKLMHAGGQAMTVYGRGKMNIMLDQVNINHEVVIAEIKDEVLLGMDILKGKDGNPADIILSQGKIILNGQEIKCQHLPQTCLRKVTAAEDYLIQGHTEQIIDAFVQRSECDDGLLHSTFIVESSTNFKENFPLLLAPCLVDINCAPTVKVRVMNPFPTDTTIRAETCIGVAEILTSPAEPFLGCEDEHEMHNMNSSRRFKFMSPQTEIQANVNAIKGHKFPSDRPTGG